MKKYIVRIESEEVPSSQYYFSPVTLEFPEPLSFRELSCLRNVLQDRSPGRFEQKLSSALARLRSEFSVQGQVVDLAVSAKILV